MTALRIFALALATCAALGGLFADMSPMRNPPLRLIAPAHALIGRPATPVSVAGVARRTTRRAVLYR